MRLKRVTMALVVCGLVSVAPADDRSEALRQAIRSGRARGVILLLGDGMGDSEITSARNYHVGAAGRLRLDSLPLTGAYTTYAVQEKDPTLPDYVTDSAASASAWATGHKTSNGRLSTSAVTDQPLQTILELAQQHGLRTGSVTTAELTDATPAALASHVNDRRCEGPADMKACSQYTKAHGGRGSIAEQTVDHHIDVLLGGGRDRFDQRIDAGPYIGLTVTQSAITQGYTIVGDAAELAAAVPGRKLLGLFATGNMTLEWKGERAAPDPGSGPQRCIEQQRPAHEPSVAAMTRKAIELLDVSDVGFFLQVEGASIDKRDHAADPCGQIGETVAFDAAVGVALDYARTHPDTLVIVTGDHAHTSQIVPAPNKDDHSPGIFSTLITADGAPMTISYATNLATRKQEHTGTQIRIAAQGPHAADVVGVTDQTALFTTMADALGLRSERKEDGFLARLRRVVRLD
jgi:alkaline phosphatase/streptomycin-6-phosphatase